MRARWPFRSPIPAAATLLGLAGGLAACGTFTETPDRLATACQVQACVCEAAETSLFSKAEQVPIEWSERGFASCPDGFVLRRTD